MSFDVTYPFLVSNLPPPLDFKDDDLIDLLLKARTQLGELNGYAFAMPNPLLLLSPAIIRESVASSNIENIYTTVERVLQQQLFPEVQQREPDKEVLHYRDAIMWGYHQMNKIPISIPKIGGVFLPHQQYFIKNMLFKDLGIARYYESFSILSLFLSREDQ